MSNPSPDVLAVLRYLGSLAQTRLTGTADEARVHDALEQRLSALGYQTTFQHFRFPRQIYGGLGVHFGLAVLAGIFAAYAPRMAALVHLVLLVSFLSEVVLRRHVLRKLWPSVATRNLLCTLPARGPLRRRIVFAAHVDSAYTGLLFNPKVLRVMTQPPPPFLPFLRKQLLLPAVCIAVMMALEAAAFATPGWAVGLLCVPPALVAFFNLQILFNNTVVPGAADNLSGCAAQVTLATEWAANPVAGVEVVFAFTGAEEAGTGGAAHLARAMRGVWDPAITDVIILDTLSNGTLFTLEEGELHRIPIPRRLLTAFALGAQRAGQPAPAPYIIPAGATDALPFLSCGFAAAALTCIDPLQGAPRHYHHPSDTVDNVDAVQLQASTRVASQVLRVLATEHADHDPPRGPALHVPSDAPPVQHAVGAAAPAGPGAAPGGAA